MPDSDMSGDVGDSKSLPRRKTLRQLRSSRSRDPDLYKYLVQVPKGSWSVVMDSWSDSNSVAELQGRDHIVHCLDVSST